MRLLMGVWLALTLTCITGCKQEPKEKRKPMTTIQYLNPEGLAHNPAFTQAIAVSEPHRVVYVGGQNAVDKERNTVGKGDIKAQTEQTLHNLTMALSAAGAKLEHVVK